MTILWNTTYTDIVWTGSAKRIEDGWKVVYVLQKSVRICLIVASSCENTVTSSLKTAIIAIF